MRGDSKEVIRLQQLIRNARGRILKREEAIRRATDEIYGAREFITATKYRILALREETP